MPIHTSTDELTAPRAYVDTKICRSICRSTCQLTTVTTVLNHLITSTKERVDWTRSTKKGTGVKRKRKPRLSIKYYMPSARSKFALMAERTVSNKRRLTRGIGTEKKKGGVGEEWVFERVGQQNKNKHNNRGRKPGIGLGICTPETTRRKEGDCQAC